MLTEIPQPYLLYLGDVQEAGYAKTAFGLRDWAAEQCIGEFAHSSAKITTGLRAMVPAEARAAGAQSLVIGIANRGGAIAPGWIPQLVEALEAGLDLVSGMHGRLAEYPELKDAAAAHGRQLIDVRRPPADLPVGNGAKRRGKRLLTVGTDCALGKKYTALALARAFRSQGLDADFRATGQTGILIAGSGLPIDSIIADFVSGAAEQLSPDAADDHWDVVEGQGSLFHPSYAGVSLGLLHGTQPDVIVLCHQIGRDRLLGLDSYPTPSIEEAIELNLKLARLTNPEVRCAGLSINTSALGEDAAKQALTEYSTRYGLPAADVMRQGAEFDALVMSCLANLS